MPSKPVPIVLADGKKRTLLFEFEAFLGLEQEFGITIEKMQEDLLAGGALRNMRALLWAGLLHEDESLTLKDVGKLIEIKNFEAISDALAKAFTEAFPAAEESESKQKN